MSDLVNELVHQFADPLAFYRELIQNSIDAGSNRIEVVLKYLPGTPGMMTVSVADWGEGMTRDTIEKYLLTKFRSAKAGDLTKIGKFGVGFMSIFACKPELVVVDTGRDGEDWRLLLNPDFSYELRRPPERLEGTRVTLHKELPPPEYRDFATRSQEAVQKWCKHAETDIVFGAGGDDGSPPPAELTSVRTPFVVDAPYQVEYREEGTLIVAGPARTKKPLAGFYNRGLTLIEKEAGIFPGVTFKVQSRYLEHTISRDNIRVDKPYLRVMKLVRSLAKGPLLERLPGELAAAAERGDGDYIWLLAFAREHLGKKRLMFPLATGGVASSAALRKTGEVFFAQTGSELAAALGRQGIPVLKTLGTGALAVAEEVADGIAVPVEECFFVALRPDDSTEARALAAHFLRIGRAGGAGFDECVVAEVLGGKVMARVDEVGLARRLNAKEKAWGKGPKLACLNRLHPQVASALKMARSQPALAALLLARVCAAGAGVLDDERDHALTAEASS